MIVQFTDSVTGTAVYVNPTYVVSMRPDPAEPTKVTILKVRDGESIRVEGPHDEVAERLSRAA